MRDGERVPGCDRDAPASSCTPNGASPGPRAANEGSDEGAEKLRLKGHTSCLMCRHSIIRIPLQTGRGRSKGRMT